MMGLETTNLIGQKLKDGVQCLGIYHRRYGLDGSCSSCLVRESINKVFETGVSCNDIIIPQIIIKNGERLSPVSHQLSSYNDCNGKSCDDFYRRYY